jgi:hypothetical protein
MIVWGAVVDIFNGTFRSPESIMQLYSPQYRNTDMEQRKQTPRTGAVLNAPASEPADATVDSKCCSTSLLSCVESDYSVRGFYPLGPDTAAMKSEPVSASEDRNGDLTVRQKGLTSSPVDKQEPARVGLRTRPAFVTPATAVAEGLMAISESASQQTVDRKDEVSCVPHEASDASAPIVHVVDQNRIPAQGGKI